MVPLILHQKVNLFDSKSGNGGLGLANTHSHTQTMLLILKLKIERTNTWFWILTFYIFDGHGCFIQTNSQSLGQFFFLLSFSHLTVTVIPHVSVIAVVVVVFA